MRKLRIAIVGAFLSSLVIGCGGGGGGTDTSEIEKSPYAPTADQWAAMRGGMAKAGKKGTRTHTTAKHPTVKHAKN